VLSKVYRKQICNSYLQATSWNFANIPYKELVKGAKSFNTTFKLFKNTYIFVTSLAKSATRVLLALSSAV
jgi:hypothetical protein